MLSAALSQFLFLSFSSIEHNRVGALAGQQEDGCLSWPGQSEHSSLPSMFRSRLLYNAPLSWSWQTPEVTWLSRQCGRSLFCSAYSQNKVYCLLAEKDVTKFKKKFNYY